MHGWAAALKRGKAALRPGPAGGVTREQQHAFDEFYLKRFAVKILPLNLAAFAVAIEVLVFVRWLMDTINNPRLAWVSVITGGCLMLLAWLCRLSALHEHFYRTSAVVLLFAVIGASLGWWGTTSSGTGIAGYMPLATLILVFGALVAPRYWMLLLGVVIILLPTIRVVHHPIPAIPHETRMLIQFTIAAFAATTLLYLLVQRVKWSYFSLLEEATTLARQDGLTGLYNRHAWTDLAQARLDAAPAAARPCVIYLDLDRFKRFNDRYGHHVGDLVLQRVARAIEQVFPQAVAARFGGDEFVVLLPSGCVACAEAGLTTLQELLATPDGTGEPVSVTFGIAVHRPPEALTETLRRADMALVRAKQDRLPELIPA